MSSRLWSRDFVVASFVNFMVGMIFYLLITSMAAYAVAQFHVGQAVAGFASSSFIVGAVFARIFTGKYMDFIGRKRLIVGSMIAFVLLGAAYIPAHNVGVLIVVRLLHGAAFGVNNTVVSAAVQSVIPHHRRAEGTGYFGMTISLATALGPFVAVEVSQRFGMMWVFILCVALSVVGTVLALLLAVEERTPSPEEQALKWNLHVSSIIDVRALPIAVIMALAGAAMSVVLSFLNEYARVLGEVSSTSWFFLVMATCTFTSRFFVGRIQDRYGDAVVMYPVFGFMLVAYVLLATANGAGMIVAAAVPLGLGFGSLMPCAQTIVVNQTTAARYGLAIATFFILLDTGTGIGPVAIGAVANLWGMRSMFWAGAVLVIIACAQYVLISRRQRKADV